MINCKGLNKAKLFYFVAPFVLAVVIASIWGSPLDGYGKTTIVQKILFDYLILTILFSSPLFFLVILVLSPLLASVFRMSDDDNTLIFYALAIFFNIFLGYVQWFYLAPKLFQLTGNYIRNGRSQSCRLMQVILAISIFVTIITSIYIFKY